MRGKSDSEAKYSDSDSDDTKSEDDASTSSAASTMDEAEEPEMCPVCFEFLISEETSLDCCKFASLLRWTCWAQKEQV